MLGIRCALLPQGVERSHPLLEGTADPPVMGGQGAMRSDWTAQKCSDQSAALFVAEISSGEKETLAPYQKKASTAVMGPMAILPAVLVPGSTTTSMLARQQVAYWRRKLGDALDLPIQDRAEHGGHAETAGRP